jgi:hypothetical protein
MFKKPASVTGAGICSFSVTLARVVERLRLPPLRHGIARELRKQQAILELEIAELQGGG